MIPVYFEGAVEIKKPADMTDEQCTSIWAKFGFETIKAICLRPEIVPHIPAEAFSGIDEDGYQYFLTAWKPSYEDLQLLNRGEPIFVKTICNGLPPMALFTAETTQTEGGGEQP